MWMGFIFYTEGIPLHMLNGNDYLHRPYNHKPVQTKHALKCDLVSSL